EVVEDFQLRFQLRLGGCGKLLGNRKHIFSWIGGKWCAAIIPILAAKYGNGKTFLPTIEAEVMRCNIASPAQPAYNRPSPTCGAMRWIL
ncbi:MAG TPA: hypothetical protein VGD52_23000, partial [Pseudoduganella sp.]